MEKQQNLEETLQAFRQGDVSLEEMLTVCRQLPYEDLGFAKLDHHRAVRQGFPEVVFCEGKTVAQVRRIMERLAAKNANILGTRANWEMYEAVREVLPQAAYHEEPRLICLERAALPKAEKRRIAVLSAGTSDIPVAEEAALTAFPDAVIDRLDLDTAKHKGNAEKILSRFAPMMQADGLMFAGHSESFLHAADLFKSLGKTVYALAKAG